jgi:hypothetical protein
MDKRQAKEILLLYRPGTSDATDPDVAAALALAAEDAELGRWLKEYCAVQEALRARFKTIPVPEGLKQQILSERRAHLSLPLKRKAAFVLAAVALAMVLGSIAKFYYHPAPDNSFGAFRQRMAGSMLRGYPPMDLETSDLGQIRAYLATNHGHGDYALPKNLEKTASTGCKILPWHGQRVSMVCFKSGKSANTGAIDLFLFIIDRANVKNPPASALPEIAQTYTEIATASWSAGDKTYVLAGLGDTEFIRAYLQ